MIAFMPHTGSVNALAFNPDGSRLASVANDSTVRVWDVESGKEIRAFTPKLGPLHWVSFAPDGLTLAFSSEKGHVGIVDVGG
ncbi:MAG: hypothetical protein L0241_07150 [Planctomycetia bacterium]|nr:hypothetical protein [Planctomycetia bacterium]